MRVGKLAYLNSAPFYYGLEQKGWSSLEMELIPRVPSELNKMMAEGQLDISVISAFEYARQHQSYYLLPRHCVSADGVVKSVLLVSRCEIESLAGGKIAMTTSSATTQNLLKVLMAKRYHLQVEYLEMAPDLKQMLSIADACLIIGDDALRIEPWAGLKVYDFATLWKEFTGYPMVFAVVAVRKEFAHAHPLHLKQFNQELSLSLAQGLLNVDKFGEREAYKEIAKKISMRDYFSCLNYQFDSRKQESLKLYYKMAAELNLCQPCLELEFAQVDREPEESSAG